MRSHLKQHHGEKSDRSNQCDYASHVRIQPGKYTLEESQTNVTGWWGKSPKGLSLNQQEKLSQRYFNFASLIVFGA